METDKDHIHYMIETEPTMSVNTPNRQVKDYYKAYGIDVPDVVDMTDYITSIYGE